MVFKPNKSTPDYLFEKANQCFRRSRTDSNARVELEALGNEFMVKAVDLDIKLQKLANDTPLPLPPHVRDAMDSCILTAPTIQLFEQGTTSEFLEVGDLSCREIKPGKPREPPAHAAAREDRG